MMNVGLRYSSLLLCMAGVLGCSIGRDRAVFVTHTNAGIEASTVPPAIAIDIARSEGAIEPQYDGGKTLPALSSFKASNAGIFQPAVGSTFATGDAAVALATLYKDPTPSDDASLKDWQYRLKLARGAAPKTDKPAFDSTITVGADRKDGRPVFFGTQTSLGIRIAWSGATAQYPDSATLGYNRKEIGIVPVSKAVDSNGKPIPHTRGLASLLATVDTGFRSEVTSPGADFNYLQYFATGEAATLLALNEEVRRAMHFRLDEPAAKLAKLAIEESQDRPRQMLALRQVYTGLTDMAAAGDADAEALVAELDAAAWQTPPPDFTAYSAGVGAPNTYPASRNLNHDFNGLLTYYERIDESIPLAPSDEQANLRAIRDAPLNEALAEKITEAVQMFFWK